MMIDESLFPGGRLMRRPASIVLTILTLAPVALAGQAQNPLSTTMIGDTFHGTNAAAANYYARAVKEKNRAAVETSVERQNHFLGLAKLHFKRSIDREPTFDAFMALGQVNLALGLPEEARDACFQALERQPGNQLARTCLDQALELLKVPANARKEP
jgi:hypothetical protein